MSDCIFCKIVSGEIPSNRVYEDENCVAFNDTSPEAPEHVLVVPKQHVDSIAQVEDPILLGNVMNAARKVADQLGLTADGYRLVINTGENGGQTVKHLHVHILGGREMKWPPG